MDTEKETRKGPGGRPKKTTHLNRFISVRFSVEEYEVVKNKAQSVGIRLSQLMRSAALHATIKGRITDEERVFIRQLTGMAINLNQIAHRGNAEGFAVAFLTFSQYEEKIRTLIQKLIT